MERETQLRNRIMRRIMAVYLMRALTSPLAKAAVFVAALSAIVSNVSVVDILANTINAAHAPRALALYFLNAYASTEFFIQLFVVVSAALGIVLVRDLCVACISGQVSVILRRLA